MNEILKSDELRNTELIDSFLLISDYNQFTESKKVVEQNLPKRDFKLSISRKALENSLDAFDLERLETKNQELLVKISPFLRRFYESYNVIAEQKRTMIGSLRDLSHELMAALTNVERIYGEMGKVSARLYHTISEFNQSDRNSEDAVLEKTFFALQNNFTCLAEVYKQESKAAGSNFYSLFNEWEKELASLDQVVKIRNCSHDEYTNFKADLKERKQKLLSGHAGKEKVEFDQISLRYACIERDSEDFKRNKAKFILPEVTFN